MSHHEPTGLGRGFGGTVFGFGNFERDPNPTRDLIRVAEQCASGCEGNGNIPGLVSRSQDFSIAHADSYLWKGSGSYVTGLHSLKIGYQHTLIRHAVVAPVCEVLTVGHQRPLVHALAAGTP